MPRYKAAARLRSRRQFAETLVSTGAGEAGVWLAWPCVVQKSTPPAMKPWTTKAMGFWSFFRTFTVSLSTLVCASLARSLDLAPHS
jgi:hypothetical protein